MAVDADRRIRQRGQGGLIVLVAMAAVALPLAVHQLYFTTETIRGEVIGRQVEREEMGHPLFERRYIETEGERFGVSSDLYRRLTVGAECSLTVYGYRWLGRNVWRAECD